MAQRPTANEQSSDLVHAPPSRKLRIFAFDPGISGEYDLAGLSEVLVDVRWEDELRRGPVGEYVEVVDVDPSSGLYYKPVDLNERYILAQNGLTPSETNPQFHQQMVYAVAMATIHHFEQALGRVALWSNRVSTLPDGKRTEKFVRRLRIYPHALRERNAYFSPIKKSLLFGYFPVGTNGGGNMPGSIVFTCLSHDIIAHETTHALLDGVHPRFNLPINPDVLAFHEAFADIVAMLQRFSYPGVLRKLVARARGNLASDNLLGQIAWQFGRATGRRHSLRDAIGFVDKKGQWQPHKPDPRLLEHTHEPHARGAVLVAAVFGAFLKVYRARTADLYRIASGGTGKLEDGEIHPDLTDRLADEARGAARYVLQMCIRAIDYCPPVGITFGDYLRAIVTADVDLNPEDAYGFRLAFVESFRQWGIYPEGMRSMSVDALLWPDLAATGGQAAPRRTVLEGTAAGSGTAQQSAVRAMSGAVKSLFTDEQSPETLVEGDEVMARRQSSRQRRSLTRLTWNLDSDRLDAWQYAEDNARLLWRWFVDGQGSALVHRFGVVIDPDTKPTVFRSSNTRGPAVQVRGVRPVMRRNVRGDTVRHLVAEITQRRRGYFDADEQLKKDQPGTVFAQDDQGDFIFRAGCTLLLDPAEMKILRVIRTSAVVGIPDSDGTIADDHKLDQVRKFLMGEGLDSANAFDAPHLIVNAREPFAMLHRGEDQDHG